MMELNRRRFIQGFGALFGWGALRGGGRAFAATNYTFYTFYEVGDAVGVGAGWRKAVCLVSERVEVRVGLANVV